MFGSNRKTIVITWEENQYRYLVAQKKKDQLVVDSFGSVAIPAGAMHNQRIVDISALSPALGQLRKQNNTKTIVFGIPMALVEHTQLTVGQDPTAKDIQLKLRQHLRDHPRLRNQDRMVEYRTIRPESGEVVVHATAVAQADIDQYVALAKKAGFTRIYLEHVETAITTTHPDQISAYVAVQLGAERTELALIARGMVVEHDVVPVGMNTVINAIATATDSSIADAEHRAREFGLGPGHEDMAVMRQIADMIEPLAYRLRRMVGSWHQERYRHSWEQVPLTGVEVYGVGVALPAWAEFLSEQCRVEVTALDRWHHREVQTIFIREELPEYLLTYLLATRTV